MFVTDSFKNGSESSGLYYYQDLVILNEEIIKYYKFSNVNELKCNKNNIFKYNFLLGDDKVVIFLCSEKNINKFFFEIKILEKNINMLIPEKIIIFSKYNNNYNSLKSEIENMYNFGNKIFIL